MGAVSDKNGLQNSPTDRKKGLCLFKIVVSMYSPHYFMRKEKWQITINTSKEFPLYLERISIPL
jgi:hypothetical protein